MPTPTNNCELRSGKLIGPPSFDGVRTQFAADRVDFYAATDVAGQRRVQRSNGIVRADAWNHVVPCEWIWESRGRPSPARDPGDADHVADDGRDERVDSFLPLETVTAASMARESEDDALVSYQMSMYCCDLLENSVSHAGQRGVATLVERTPDRFLFHLQSRAVAFGEERRLRLEPSDIRVNIDFTVGISFCPWCGKRLQELAAAAPREFTELARRHEPFIPRY